eukprot:CAMPEP_0175971872 /NCGR_PEP_ID=MMETSP0108-20121206/41900_1 /TAXON_ID=195067 ORGANISM="Goniomonas pacifica, Strain CCMP1869" /NCGR_SAMPLE_ID=MMETSP0108 /ASSEMBLY_ACC=CAM_ASM_000204 /LENGTH=31 /DNA_ID= /DNA_START= /DNA_END= /DNA_ORIENTATION=
MTPEDDEETMFMTAYNLVCAPQRKGHAVRVA